MTIRSTGRRSDTGEDPHLGGRPQRGVLRADREEAHAIAESLAHPTAPGLELLPRPLEAVVGVTERARGQGLEAHVVLDVRRGDDDRLRPRELEHGTLERRQARGVEMLDHLDHGRRVVALDPPVTIRERSVQQADPLALRRRQPVEPQPRKLVESTVLVAGIFRPPTLNTPTLGEPPRNVASASNETPFPLTTVMPRYPPLARDSGIVLVEARVDAGGGVADVKVIRSARPFDEPALDAARWLNTPKGLALAAGRGAL